MAAIYYNPQDALVTDWRSFFLDHRDDMFMLPCEEGSIELNGRFMLLNIMLCMPLIKRNRPISREKHLFLEGIYDSDSHAKIMTQISKSLEEVGYSREDLGHDIIMTANNALNMCYTHLGSYIRTMDIFSIADTVLQEGVKELCQVDYGDISDRNINRMQDAFKKRSAEVTELFLSDKLDINVFRAPLKCGALKEKQFHQFVVSAGPRTDTDDHMFLRPVVPPFLAGMANIMDLAIESRSAAKASHYNKTQMSSAQYLNRKIHIQSSVTWHLYEGDCGSNVYITYEPTANWVKYFIGKFYLTESGTLQELTEDRFKDVIGKKVLFRDPPGCRWTDGYCEVCGGTITKSFSKTGNVGFLANIKTGAPVAQQVLSTKHLISTDAAEYEVPHEFMDILSSETNDIYIRPSVHKKIKTMVFGFQPNGIAKINDLKYYVSENELHAAYFTDIKYMYLGILKEDGTVTKDTTRTPMGGESKTYPHLSPEVLRIIRNHPDDIIFQDGIAWLSLRNIDPTVRIMQCTVVNNSIRRFVNRFASLVTKDVERYTSMNDFMRDLIRLIYPRVGSHITHMSTLARGCLITSRKDFHIPQITDPDNVMFAPLGRNIPMRSIGGLLAYERYNLATNKPATFITPKRTGIMDHFMGYSDQIVDEMNWPVTTGSPVEYE